MPTPAFWWGLGVLMVGVMMVASFTKMGRDARAGNVQVGTVARVARVICATDDCVIDHVVVVVGKP